MSNSRGFTLIELLVVITIIGLLAASVLSATSSARASGRDSAQHNEVKQLQSALELYRLRNQNQYPCQTGSNPGPCMGQLSVNHITGADPADFIFANALRPYYQVPISDSPGWNETILYYAVALGPAYRISVRFERDRRNAAGVTIPAGTWCRIDNGNIPSSVPGSGDPQCY